jgi:hypothetical protein
LRLGDRHFSIPDRSGHLFRHARRQSPLRAIQAEAAAAGLVEHTGAMSNDKDPRCCRDELGDHVLGRSRGGLSTKIHAALDGRGRRLAILLTPGQAGDAPKMLPLLAHLHVQRTIGPPRTRPDRVLAEKAYSVTYDPTA